MSEEIDIEDLAPWLVLFLTLLGFGLRVLLLAKNGLWLDETFSIWLSSHSLADLLQWTVKIDQHPPLYYLLLHYWILFNGDSAYYVRLLSAFFGAGTIPVIYLIGKRMSGAVMGLAAAMLLAFSPFNIYYAQETRMYTLLAFNAAVAIYALVSLLTDPRSARPIGSQFRDYLRNWRTMEPVGPGKDGDFSYQNETRNQTGWRGWISHLRWDSLQTIETDLAWVALIVFSAATLLTHNTAVLFILAINLFVLGLLLSQKIWKPGSSPAFQAPSLGNWVKAQLGIFILWSPWLLAFIQQTNRVDQEFWLPKPDWETVTRTLRYLSINLVPSTASQVMTWVLCAVLCLALVYYRKKLSLFFFLVTLFAVPFLGELLVSLRRPIFLDRTLIWLTIPLFLALAAGIAQLRQRFLMIAVLGILSTNYLFAASDYYRFVQKEDWSNAAREIVAFAEQGDLVLFNATWVQIPFDYYFRNFNIHDLQIEERGIPSDMFESGILEPKMTESEIPKLISMLRGRERVWLVYSHNSYTDPEGLIPQTLASQMKLIKQENFYGGQVQLYGTP